MIWNYILFIFYIIITYYLYIIFNYYINFCNYIQGLDNYFINRKYNIITVRLEFEDDIPQLKEYLCKFLYNELSKKNSKLRLIKKNNKFYYKNIDYIDFIKNNLIYLKEINYKIVEKLYKKNILPFIIIYNNNNIYISFDHQFLDGYSLYKILNKLFNNNKIIFKPPTIYYIPVYTELILLIKYINLNINVKNRNLNYYPDNFSLTNTKFKTTNLFVQNIKYLKNKYNVSFNTVMVAILCNSVFNSSDIQKLNVGIIVAFDSFTKFNNYGILFIEVKKPYNDNFSFLILMIDDLINKNKDTALLTYSISNIYNINSESKLIDILISGMPISINNNMTINNIKLKNTEQYLNYNSMPIYSMFITNNNIINLSLSIRSPDIDDKKFLEYINMKYI